MIRQFKKHFLNEVITHCKKISFMIILTLGSLFISLSFYYGDYAYFQQLVPYFDKVLWVKIMIRTIITFLLILFLFCFLECFIKYYNKLKAVKFKSDRYFIIFCMFIMLLAWSRALFALFPGILNFDTHTQYLYGVAYKELNNYHTILHTALFASLVRISEFLTGSHKIGVLIYSVIQMLILSFAFASLCNELRKLKLPRIIVYFCVLVFAFHPTNAVFSVTMTKDVMFTAFFVLYAVCLFQLISNTEEFIASRRKCLYLVVISFLVCAFRNNGVYSIAVSNIVLLFMLKTRKVKFKYVLQSLLPFLLLWIMYTGPLFTLLGVTRTSEREALSVPIQGIARTMKLYENQLSENEKKEITRYVPGYAAYMATLSDPVKYSFNVEDYKSNPIEFYTFWLALIRKVPQSFLDAFLENTANFWYPKSNYDGMVIWNYDFEAMALWNDYYSPLGNMKTYSPPNNEYYHIFYNMGGVKLVPFGSLFLKYGMSFIYLVLIGVYLFFKPNHKMIFLFIPFVLLYATILFGPQAHIRYVYPLLCAMPIFIAAIFINSKMP